MENGQLGNAIRNARIKMNYSQEKVAELVGITPTHLKHLESEHRKPSIEVLFNLCQTLNISLDSLLFPSEIERPLLIELSNKASKCTDNQLKILLAVIHEMISQNESSLSDTK